MNHTEVVVGAQANVTTSVAGLKIFKHSVLIDE